MRIEKPRKHHAVVVSHSSLTGANSTALLRLHCLISASTAIIRTLETNPAPATTSKEDMPSSAACLSYW